ncbi:hypothetical protein ZIOFF_067324 [Zingiber officinale]|uniref:Sm domain-containing protein n=1 Tax=Zingiber officinale TaxID=94328 RepID=A0A8J5CX43_ZINOF|nr:hypothetical protein ZIOFF_067324 [Zingiber officinale]
MLFFSYFKELVGKEVTVELKNDLAIRGTLHSVDQYLNIKLENIKVVDEDKYPHMLLHLSLASGIHDEETLVKAPLPFPSHRSISSGSRLALRETLDIWIYRIYVKIRGFKIRQNRRFCDNHHHVMLHMVLAVDVYSDKIKHLFDAAEGQEVARRPWGCPDLVPPPQYQNKKERKKVREVGILKKDPEAIREQIEKMERMSK